MLKVILHLIDLTSDYIYITTVPLFTTAIYWLLIGSVLLPLIPQLFVAMLYTKRVEYDKERDEVKIVYDELRGIKFYFLGYLGLFDIIENN